MAGNAKRPQLLPAYLVTGDETLKRKVVMRRLRQRVDQMGDISLNLDAFDGQKATGEEIVAACNTMPFVGEKRLVEVTAADRLRAADRDAVIDYLSSPSPTTVLELVTKGLAKNTRLYKAVAKLGRTAIIVCEQPKRREVPDRVRKMAQVHGLAMTPGAVMELIDLVGDDMEAVEAQLGKLTLSHRGSDPVNESEVASQVSRTSEAKPWEFTDALSARDAKKCLLVLSHMKNPNAVMLMTMSVNRLRELMAAKALAAQGRGDELAGRLHVSPWRVKNHAMWARNYTAEELDHALVAARDADEAMKSGGDANAVFTDWWVSLVTGRPVPLCAEA